MNAIRLRRMRQLQHNWAILASGKNDAGGIAAYIPEEVPKEPSAGEPRRLAFHVHNCVSCVQ